MEPGVTHDFMATIQSPKWSNGLQRTLEKQIVWIFLKLELRSRYGKEMALVALLGIHGIDGMGVAYLSQ